MRVSFLAAIMLALSLTACAHEAENTGMQNSQSTITLPSTFAMAVPARQENAGSFQLASASVVAAPGNVSRYQRTPIVMGGPNGAMTPCAENFDGIMDHLELLMSKQIAENNAIAEKQAALPRYDF